MAYSLLWEIDKCTRQPSTGRTMIGCPVVWLAVSISRKESDCPMPVPFALAKASFAANLPAKYSIFLCPVRVSYFFFRLLLKYVRQTVLFFLLIV